MNKYYILYYIDNINKLYIKTDKAIMNRDMLEKNEADYQRIIEYANRNNYIINYINEKVDNYEDISSLKKNL